MSKIYQKITDLIGGTPLLELANYEKKNNLEATVLGKLEYFNPLRFGKRQNRKGNG